jgi:DNA-binding HxlR family transcriptional regulator
VRNGAGRLNRVNEQRDLGPYGDFEADRPARIAVDLFSNCWLTVIVYTLRDGPMRPGDLRATIGHISQKVLTQTLRRMENMALVERRRYAEVPAARRVLAHRGRTGPAGADLRSRRLVRTARRLRAQRNVRRELNSLGPSRR